MKEVNDRLTEKQKAVLAAVKEMSRKLGKSPTLDELRDELDYKRRSSVQRHLEALKKKGYLTSEKHKPRSLRVEKEEMENIPLIGNVAAGTPLLAQENVEGHIPYPKDKLRSSPQNYFFLRAVGDSMDKAGINNNDFVLVRKTPVAESGNIVVALIGDEATIKKLDKQGDYYVLEPRSSNPDNKKIILFENFAIQGVVEDVKEVGE